MTKFELEQLRSLKLEIKAIQDELHNLPVATDTVEGSGPEFPYVKHKIKIRGLDDQRGAALRLMLEEKMEMLRIAIQTMEEWLDLLPDSEIRTILRMKYRNGMKDHEIAMELEYCRQAISMKIKRFFDGSKV